MSGAQQFCVRWNSYHTNLQTVFPKLLSTENFADVTLACESRQLRCHKVVLSACSAYFERLLVQNPCKHPIIFMKDMRFSEMQSLVDFMYKGEVNVTQDDLPSLLKSAEALQIRGLCSADAGSTEQSDKATQATHDTQPPPDASQGAAQTKATERTNGACPPVKKRNGPEPGLATGDFKEEKVEEDGLFYGELDGQIDYNEEDEPGKAGSSADQPSGSQPLIRVKPECKLLQPHKDDYLARLSEMSPLEARSELAKYTFDAEQQARAHDDYYKSWLEQNGELEVSLLKANGRKGEKEKKSLLEKTLKNEVTNYEQKVDQNQPRKVKRGRPPLKDKALASALHKTDLDQFLEGKEVSSSGLSRRDLERVMMGKFNPNRRYSNEAMWAALMDVKRGGSIYRAAQTHKVPRKSLRNWMKRCHIKSSFPMPQQLKQFVENNRRQRLEHPGAPGLHAAPDNLTQAAQWLQNVQKMTGGDVEMSAEDIKRQLDFGKHFLSMAENVETSEEEAVKDGDPEVKTGCGTDD